MRILRNSGLLFYIYALVYHYILCRIKSIVSHKGRVNRSKKNESLKLFSSLKEIINYKNPIIYGKDLVLDYSDDKEKNILLVSHQLTMTGAPIALVHLAKILVRKGFQPIIISPTDGAELAEYAVSGGIPVIVNPDIFETDLILKVRDIFGKILVNTLGSLSVIKLLCNTDTNVLWWIHESSECYSRELAEMMPRKISDNIHVYCVGPYARRQLSTRFPKYKVDSLIYYTPDLKKVDSLRSEVYERIDGNKKVFAIIAGINRRKGHDILFNAVLRLPKDVLKDSQFIIVGQPGEPFLDHKLRRLIAKYPESVIYPGALKLEEVYKLYEKIDYVICASRDDPMPIVVAEAMSFGVPCICSEYTGSSMVIKHFKSGLIYGRNSSKMLARRIEEAFYMDAGNYERMSQKARVAYEKVFSEEAFEKNLCKVLFI